MSIPKKIHYCWFGNNKKNKLINNCIASWKTAMPEFEFIEWNESNFDVTKNSYANDAYNKKKWAFVTDYARLWILNTHGGIYLDTDVEVFKSLDQFREHNFFSGFENYHNRLSPIVTAVMGAQKGNKLIQRLLLEYEKIKFTFPDGTINTTSNTSIISKILCTEYNVTPDIDSHIQIDEGMHIYPSTFFCTKNPNSFCMHHFSGSWLTPIDKLTPFILEIKCIDAETKERIIHKINIYHKKLYNLTKKAKSLWN